VKVGDLVQPSKDAVTCASQRDVVGCGIVVEFPFPYSHAMVLWDDGEIEDMWHEDLWVIQ
jgi:hypothetical protein